MPDFTYEHYRRVNFVKYVKFGNIIGCDDVGNILVWQAQNLKLVRSIPYGRVLNDAIGTKNHVYCAFESKLVVFNRADWSIETKFDTSEEINCLAENEFNHIRVCGKNGFNW